MRQLSIGTWSFTVGACAGRPEDLDTVIRRAAEIGYDGVALGGFTPHASVELYPTRSSRRELMRKVQDCGLSVNSYAADLLDCDFYTGASEALGKYRERFERSLELCADCEIPIIRVDTVTMTPYPPEFDYQRAWDTTVALFAENAAKARTAGVLVAWEFEPGRLFNKPAEILSILQAVDERSFTIQYDTAHGQLCAVVGAHQYGQRETLAGGQAELIEALAGRIADVHLIDSDGTMRNDTNSNKVPFGTGVVDFLRIVPALLQAGYPGRWWTVDLGPQEGDVWAVAREAHRYVSGLLEGLPG